MHEDIHIDGEVVTDIALTSTTPNHALQMSPGSLREQIARDKELRTILREYVESEMVENQHYYYMSRVSNPDAPLRKGEKPALMQDGAFMFINLFKYTPGTVRKNIIRTDDGHFTVEAEAPIFDGNGRLVATGDGSCSTRESKYAFRKSERTCPTCEQPAIRKDNKDGGWYCWAKIGGCGAKFNAGNEAIESQQLGRVENPDIADVENTVLKMAIKRATVAAVRKLPLVSDLFTVAPNDDTPPPKPAEKKKETKPSAPPPAKPEEDPAAIAELRGKVEALLESKIGDDADARKQFLKGRDPQMMPTEALNKMLGDLEAM